jgi:hypothetical protein
MFAGCQGDVEPRIAAKISSRGATAAIWTQRLRSVRASVRSTTATRSGGSSPNRAVRKVMSARRSPSFPLVAPFVAPFVARRAPLILDVALDEILGGHEKLLVILGSGGGQRCHLQAQL